MDPVATDVYSSTVMGFSPEEVRPSQLAFDHGLGEVELEKINVIDLSD
jgi:hypothetical protein